ncbi:MAG: hypothetical protein II497_02820, partial [Lachnospiraceae bacterium]|nr:hypothetical protein [Lachnospiraceae bacterium]
MDNGIKKKQKGLQKKIFGLCVSIITVAIVVFAVIGIMQLRLIFRMASETGRSQTVAIKDKSRET